MRELRALLDDCLRPKAVDHDGHQSASTAISDQHFIFLSLDVRVCCEYGSSKALAYATKSLMC